MVELLDAPERTVPGDRLRRLTNADSAALVALCAEDPIVNCFPLSRVAVSLAGNSATSFWGWFDTAGALSSAMYVGANIVPIATDRISRLAFADRLIRVGPRCSAVVGPAEEVLDLWDLLEPSWSQPRDIRPRQRLLVTSTVVRGTPRLPLRFAGAADLPALMPACIAMFTEEIGITPERAGMTASYEARVRELVSSQRALVHIIDDVVVFKAELGAVAHGVCQIQGVWVHPEWRGQGLGTSGMAATVDIVLRDIADVVSLYANSHNDVALATYRSVGFAEHDIFATVLR